MTEAQWRTCDDPRVMLFPPEQGRRHDPQGLEACHPRVTGERKLRLYACGCFRLSFPQLRFAADRRALDVAERFADGDASEDELTGAADRCGLTAALLLHPAAINAARNAPGGKLVRHDHPAGPQVPLADPVKCRLLRCVFGNPFRPATADPRWLTSTAVGLAEAIYVERAFDRLPILADALEDAGCDSADLLAHCRDGGPHVRGCWAVDLVLGWDGAGRPG